MPDLRDELPLQAPLVQTRTAILVAAIAMNREVAFRDASVPEIARRASVPIETIRELFPTDAELLLAVVDRWNVLRMTPIMPLLDTHGTVTFLHGLVTATQEDRAFSRFLIALVNVASTDDEPAAAGLIGRWAEFRRMVERGLARDIERGREPATMSPESGAEQLVALYEGLQLQFLVRPGMNLIASFDRAVTRMRDGWARTYEQPVWDLAESRSHMKLQRNNTLTLPDVGKSSSAPTPRTPDHLQAGSPDGADSRPKMTEPDGDRSRDVIRPECSENA